jgi:hypothetical protein
MSEPLPGIILGLRAEASGFVTKAADVAASTENEEKE